MSSSSFNDAFIHTPRYFTWFKNCTRTPFRKIFDGAGCLYFFGQKRTPIVLLQLKAIFCVQQHNHRKYSEDIAAH